MVGSQNYWGYIGIVQNEMETTIGFRVVLKIMGPYWLYRDYGRENGSYYLGFRVEVILKIMGPIWL